VAASMLTAVFFMFRDGIAYEDLGAALSVAFNICFEISGAGDMI
jgi:hypothetical protein